MSNKRRARRLRHESTGQVVEYRAGVTAPLPDSKNRAPLPVPTAGEHFWIMTGLWRIADPATAFDPGVEKYLDLENLVSIDGPGCLICEEIWTAEIAAAPCPGEPPR